MNSDDDNPNLQHEGEHEANAICNCVCQEEIASLRAENSNLKDLLENLGVSLTEPATKKLRLDESRPAEDWTASEQNGINVTKVDGSDASESVGPAEVFTDVVLRNIGSYLSVQDLLECRLVCKAWKETASSVLRTRSTYLRLGVDGVPEFICSARRSQKFPFAGYQWGYYFPEEEQYMRNCLQEFSHLFSRLRLRHLFCDYGSASEVVEFLATYFPHVEVLDMSEMDYSSRIFTSPQEISLITSRLEELHFPELRLLVLPSWPTLEGNNGFQAFITQLMRAAPKLHRIVGFAPAFTTALISAGKMNDVTTMKLGSTVTAGPLITVALNPPCQLSKLVVDDLCYLWRENRDLQNAAWNAFLAVLRANREILESLKMVDLGSQLTDLPVFPHLKYLHIVGDPIFHPDVQLFPENVSNYFPALHTVTVELQNSWNHVPDNAEQDFILKAFLWSEPLLSVTSLNIQFAIDEDGIDFFGRIFPNVTQLWIDWEKCYHTSNGKYREGNLWDIWTVPFKLERLEIYRFNPWAVEDFSLDSFLTGIHESVCRNLRKEGYAQLPMASAYYDALRGYPNMLNLSETLRELIISIDYPPTPGSRHIMSQREEYNDTIASPVSTFYGTRLMANKLQLYLAYDHRKFYSSQFKEFVAPNKEDVTIIHQNFPEPRRTMF